MYFVCGYICSGKTTLGKKISTALSYSFVDISSIVKDIIGQSGRDKLQQTAYVEKEIIDRLKTMRVNTVVCGVRQSGILKAFSDANMIWIDVPRSVRLERYLARSDEKDILTVEGFEKAEQGDIALGIEEVKNFIFTRK